MSEPLYWIWAILPFVLFVMSIKAAGKRVTKARTKEYPLETFKPALYCSGLLVLAILIDQFFLEDLFEMIPLEVDWRIFRWLLYPAILTLAATGQHYFSSKKDKEHREEMRKRQLEHQRTFNR